MGKRWRKGSVVELTRDLPRSGLKAGAIGRVVKSRKERGYDAYKYDVDFGGGRVFVLFDSLLARGRHSSRCRDPEGAWRCVYCGRKVKGPDPCPKCGGYHFYRKRRDQEVPMFTEFAGERVCSGCADRLPQKLKTDGRGRPLRKGDVVSITGGPIQYMGQIGMRARVLRRGKHRVTIEFADGTRAWWSYRSLSKTDLEPTDPGDLKSGREIAKILGRIFG